MVADYATTLVADYATTLVADYATTLVAHYATTMCAPKLSQPRGYYYAAFFPDLPFQS